nr:MAG TPA: cysteine-rich protein [Caudoviricetes sp.]
MRNKKEDDLVQLENPDEEGCDNHMSLNQAREAYSRGEEVY